MVGPIFNNIKPNILILQNIDSINSSNINLLKLLNIKDDIRITDVDNLFQNIQYIVRLEKKNEKIFDEISDSSKKASEFPAMLTA